MTYKVSRKRSLIKSITWRIVASLDTFVIAWFVTGKSSWAGIIAMFEVLTKTFLYYIHERQWNKVRWGKRPEERATPSWYRALFMSTYRKLNGKTKTDEKR